MTRPAKIGVLGASGYTGSECVRLLLRHLRHREFQEQVEPLDQESEGHHRNGGADPGEKSSLVGGMVAVAFDHWTAPMMCRHHYSAAAS